MQTPAQPLKAVAVKPRKATRKEAEYARIVATEPSTTQRAAYKRVYKGQNMSDKSIDVEATRTLAKPQVQSELAKYEDRAEDTLVEVMGYSRQLGKSGTGAGASYAATAGQLANSIIDRLRGKATQRIEQHITSVTIGIDLTATTDTEK